MLKPPDLRQHLTSAVPDLGRDPEKLIVLAKGGKLVNTGTPSLSFEYRYTLNIIVLDFAGHADGIMVPLLEWARRNQPELFDNEQLRQNAIRFDVEYLTTSTVDLSIEIDLTERVLIRARADGPEGALNVIHVGEPPVPGAIDKAEHWSLWLQDELIAEWDINPWQPPPSP